MVDEISIVGRGARGLGIAIDREIGEARREREGASALTVSRKGRNGKGAGSSRRRPGASVFPMTADIGQGEGEGVRVVEYDFEERR